MLVYHFNTGLDGGAAIAVRRLHDSLQQYGVLSRYYHSPKFDSGINGSYCKFEHKPLHLTFTDKIRDRFNGRHQFRKNFDRKLDHFLRNRPTRQPGFSYTRFAVDTPFDFQGQKPSIVHLHWVSGLFDFPSFFSSIPKDLPIVWTLHDMNPFTGGCHYSWDCSNYRSECGNCPQLNENRSRSDLSNENWKIKWSALAERQIHVVANSFWLEQCSRESKVFSRAKSIRTIHYGLDTDLFCPLNKLQCKQALGIDANAFVLCFGADGIDVRRKGFQEFLEALAKLRDIPVKVLLFGTMNTKISRMKDVDLRFLGRLDSLELLRLIYSASDTFVISSLQESFGQTALEAMACGTPVTGFSTGGISDMVRPNVTGLLADAGSAEDLAQKIRWMALHPNQRIEMGLNARKTVEQEFSLDLQARKYIELYESLVR